MGMPAPTTANEAPGEVDRRISRRVGEWLREEDGRSQAALSTATGIPTTSLSHYVRGTRRWPASAVHAVSKALDLTICGLYGVDEGHMAAEAGTGKAEVLAARLASALELGPERIEINVYVRGAT